MSTGSQESLMTKYRAQFIHNHGQKPSLTMITPTKMTEVLYKLYPLLIMTDCALNNLMWISDDWCLPFIQLIALCVSINSLVPTDTIRYDNSCDFTSLFQEFFNSWIGMISILFLGISVVYYVQSVYEDISHSEQPTLDDIVVTLESVVDKLEIILSEKLNHGLNITSWKSFLKTVMFVTPFQVLLMRYISAKQFTISFIIIYSLYHSVWFQATFKIFWRIMLIRKIYYSFYYKFDTRILKNYSTIDLFNMVYQKEIIINLPFSKTLKGLEERRLNLFLQKLYPQDTKLEKLSFSWSSPNCIKMIEVEINENQRKWFSENWNHKLLPYEQHIYTINYKNNMHKSFSPWEIELELPDGWNWLDDSWLSTSWAYSDTNWNLVGNKESLESCTRSRIWKRRLYHL